MSDKSNNTPKPVTVQPAPAAPAVKKTAEEIEHERMLEVVESIPAGADVFVLTPFDGLERAATLDQLEGAFFKYFEKRPHDSHELKAGRLPHGSVMFVAHCVTERSKRPDGTFGDVKKIHIGGPIYLNDHRSASSDGYTFNTNLGSVVDAVTKAAKHSRGTVWLGGLSGDHVYEQKVIKLHKS